MSIFYIQIANQNPKAKIGEIFNVSDGGSIQDVNTIQSQAETILSSQDIIKNTQQIINDIPNFTLYYYLTESGTFYFIAVFKKYIEIITSQIVFEIFAEIERQNIKHQTDIVNNTPKLTSTAQQNLSLLIEKYISQAKESKDSKDKDDNRGNASDRTSHDNSADISLDNPIPVGDGTDEVKEVQIVTIENIDQVDGSNKHNSFQEEERYQRALKQTFVVKIIMSVIGFASGAFFIYKIWF
jgi:hypothetical protein